jgi:hypothetical protein
MSSKEYIPLRTFDGFLKQQARDALSAPEQRLFDTLFPSFQGSLSSADAGAHDKDDDFHTALTNLLAEILSPLIQVAPAEARPRRFAGYELPRRRYFTLCYDEARIDLQTLAHELRAYRDPVEVGMVEVIDLAQGCTLSINNVQIPLLPQPAIAVLIHEPEKLPPELYALDFVRLPGLIRQETFLYRFPYTVSKRQIPRTVDLRFPEVNMLPTLINPDLGGGSPADTGSTLLMVGH